MHAPRLGGEDFAPSCSHDPSADEAVGLKSHATTTDHRSLRVMTPRRPDFAPLFSLSTSPQPIPLLIPENDARRGMVGRLDDTSTKLHRWMKTYVGKT